MCCTFRQALKTDLATEKKEQLQINRKTLFLNVTVYLMQHLKSLKTQGDEWEWTCGVILKGLRHLCCIMLQPRPWQHELHRISIRAMRSNIKSQFSLFEA